MATEKEKLKAVRSMQKIRETRIKAGGKSIGTTIDADSACALELLCNRYDMQQREVIQLALQHLLLLKLPLRAVREAIGEPYNG
jgi:hypothetical protein